MKRKKALIAGVAGQDGGILYDHLLSKDYDIAGFDLGRVRSNCAPELPGLDILDAAAVAGAVASFRPDEIYYLAARHSSSQDAVSGGAGDFSASLDVNLKGAVNFLEAMRLHARAARFFYAGSSHIFKGSGVGIQNENTPMAPVCVYGITKAAGILACRYYRNIHSLYVSAGILYNHESPARSGNFLSRKIVSGAVLVKRGVQRYITVGSLDAAADWGYAPDYVEAMNLILGLDSPDDFVIATGVPHTVRELAAAAFGALGMNYLDHVHEDPSLVPKNNFSLVGDSSRLREAAGWTPKTAFADMIKLMVERELRLQADTAS